MDELKDMDFSLSVIIPNYNNEKYIGTCLDSILEQSHVPDEIIVVDDCSIDHSRDIISEYARNNKIIRPLFLSSNGGVSNARNKGLEIAESTYVTFIDADDFYFNKEKLKNEMTLIKHHKSKGKDIVAYSITAIVNTEGNLAPNRINRKWSKKQFVKGKSFVTLISMSKQMRVPRDYCIRKDILNKVGAYSFYKNFYEDLDLLMRIAESGLEFYCTYKFGTAYRRSEGGLSLGKKGEHKKTIEEIQKSYYKKLNFWEKVECCGKSFAYKTKTILISKIMIPVRDFVRRAR